MLILDRNKKQGLLIELKTKSELFPWEVQWHHNPQSLLEYVNEFCFSFEFMMLKLRESF